VRYHPLPGLHVPVPPQLIQPDEAAAPHSFPFQVVHQGLCRLLVGARQWDQRALGPMRTQASLLYLVENPGWHRRQKAESTTHPACRPSQSQAHPCLGPAHSQQRLHQQCFLDRTPASRTGHPVHLHQCRRLISFQNGDIRFIQADSLQGTETTKTIHHHEPVFRRLHDSQRTILTFHLETNG